MDKVIKKFTLYLIEYCKELKVQLIFANQEKVEEISKEVGFIKYILNIFTTEQETNQHYEFFYGFDNLSEYLLSSNLNSKEYKEIIFYFIKRNLNLHIVEKPTLMFDLKNIKKYKFESMTNQEAEDLILKTGIHDLLEQEEGNLSSIELKRKQEILTFARKYSIDISKEIEYHRILKEHYFDKLISYQEFDIEEINDALINLKIDPKICDAISHVLMENYQKREAKKKPMEYSVYKVSDKESNLLTDKEYKQIRKELKTYYDFYHNKMIRPLSKEEQIYCIFLMQKIGLADQDIYNFLLRVTSSYGQEKEEDPLRKYQENYQRLKYYEEKYQLKEIEILEEDYQIMKDLPEEEFKLWEPIFKEELNAILYSLSDKFDYELESAKKLQRKREKNQ